MTRKISVILSLSIALVTLLILSRSGSFEESLKMWRLIPGKALLWAFVLYILTYPLRAFRWILLMEDFKGIRTLWEFTIITGIHTAVTNFLPFKSGELVFPMLLKGRGHSFSSSMIYLFMGRLMDLSVMITLFALFYMGLRAFLPVILILSLIFSFRGKAFRFYEGMSSSAAFLQRFLPALGRLSRLSMPGGISLFLVTSMVWMLKLLAVAIITSTVSGDPLGRMLFLSLGAEMAFLVPLSGWLGLGNYEAGWAIASSLSGPSPDAGAAFFAHTFLILASAIAGLISVFLYFYAKRGRA